MEVMTTRFFNVLLHPECVFNKTKLYPIVTKAGSFMKNYCEQVLSNVINDTTRDAATDDSKTFINQLLKISNSTEAFNFQDIVLETISTMLAVSDCNVGEI
jgi:hypothetical protein